ncbi:glycerol-3-phosphate dehydrogenase C-terminal domain-containing protein, partial [Streptococcus pyogenes]
EGLTLAQTLSLHYAMRYEMALSPVDFFLRRTNYMLFKREEVDALMDPVLNEMSTYYDWSADEKAAAKEKLEQVLSENDLRH